MTNRLTSEKSSQDPAKQFLEKSSIKTYDDRRFAPRQDSILKSVVRGTLWKTGTGHGHGG